MIDISVIILFIAKLQKFLHFLTYPKYILEPVPFRTFDLFDIKEFDIKMHKADYDLEIKHHVRLYGITRGS